MREAVGDLWTLPADMRCVTTNGTVRKDMCAVMGKGCAREAAERYPGLALRLGKVLTQHGNHVFVIAGLNLITFPVKHQWYENASLELIKQSTLELISFIDSHEQGDSLRILLPRPGCGNGGLTWEQVKPIVEILPDTVTVVSRKGD